MNNNQKGNDWFKKGNSHYEAECYEEAICCFENVLGLESLKLTLDFDDK